MKGDVSFQNEKILQQNENILRQEENVKKQDQKVVVQLATMWLMLISCWMENWSVSSGKYSGSSEDIWRNLAKDI